MRRDRNLLNSVGSFSLRYNLPYKFLKSAMRYHHMGDLNNPQVKFRLAFIDFFFKFKDVSLTCRVFKISRPTFYKSSINLLLTRHPQNILNYTNGVLTMYPSSTIYDTLTHFLFLVNYSCSLGKFITMERR
jgi:hypothetical protein